MKHKKIFEISICTVVVFLIASACTSPSPASTPVAPTPTSVPSPTLTMAEMNPSPRGYVSMAYDSESNQVILFGGQTGVYTDPANDNDETWAFDVTSNTWKEMKPSVSPPAGAAGVLAYDVESDRVILYGNTRILSTSNTTWAYDFNSNTWTKMEAKGPDGHLGLKMAYDVESDRIILFGGYDVQSNSFYDDTWAYDFNSDSWVEMKPAISPAGRNFHMMTYDSKIDRVLMWGGDRGEINAIWAYDFNTNTWEQKETKGGPGRRAYGVLTYDAASDQTVLFGGNPGGSNDVWSYDYNQNQWKKMDSSEGPRFLSRHAFLYIPGTDRFILFGGQLGAEEYTYTQQTWAYDLNTNTWEDVTRSP
jgi:N-acetylneuraminic acid mutarotase